MKSLSQMAFASCCGSPTRAPGQYQDVPVVKEKRRLAGTLAPPASDYLKALFANVRWWGERTREPFNL
jgi:hypothetical protein